MTQKEKLSLRAAGEAIQLKKKSGSPRGQTAARDDIDETGGPKGPDPTRYGDWEIAGKCVDF